MNNMGERPGKWIHEGGKSADTLWAERGSALLTPFSHHLPSLRLPTWATLGHREPATAE